jgi:serine/threonine protein kinase
VTYDQPLPVRQSPYRRVPSFARRGARPAQKLGDYELLGLIVAGGMAEVWAARRTRGGRGAPVAIKRIRPELIDEPDIVAMFRDEGRLAAQLHHPNICEVVEVGEDRGEPFIVMEYLRGVPLSLLFVDGMRMSPRVAVGIVTQACVGLHHAHELRDRTGRPLHVVHRDVAPDNLFVAVDGTVKLLDFGIAKCAKSTVQTEAGKIKGKLRYMSPEQVIGEGVDRRTDVWSLGAVLLELLTGQRLFVRSSAAATARAIVAGEVPQIAAGSHRELNAISAVVQRALRTRSEHRFPTALEMEAALLHALLPAEPAGPRDIAAWVRTCGEESRRSLCSLVGETPTRRPAPRAGDWTAAVDEEACRAVRHRQSHGARIVSELDSAAATRPLLRTAPTLCLATVSLDCIRTEPADTEPDMIRQIPADSSVGSDDDATRRVDLAADLLDVTTTVAAPFPARLSLPPAVRETSMGRPSPRTTLSSVAISIVGAIIVWVAICDLARILGVAWAASR